MKRILFFLLCALLVQSVSFAQLPSVKLSLANNKKFDTKNLADGKTPVVISFWSISCDPCIQEIDALNEAYDDWQEEVPFKLVLVSTDDTRFTAQAKDQRLVRLHLPVRCEQRFQKGDECGVHPAFFRTLA